MVHIKLFKKTGSFAANKDIAKEIRLEEIIPALEKGNEVILDFENINSATQSFIHALISDLMRQYGNDVLDKISFKSCNETIQKIITIVTDYMQERE
jgi:SepF-like predicted cell division protein (DUF552 family)